MHQPHRGGGVVDDLERGGLITRAPNPTDRRARQVMPTPEGLDLLARTSEVVDEIEARWLLDVPVADRAVFLRVLQGVAAKVPNGDAEAVDCRPDSSRRQARQQTALHDGDAQLPSKPRPT